jgi:hypothetical protein
MAKASGLTRPSLFWFLLLDGGIVALTALAYSKKTHETVSEMSGDTLPPQSALRNLLIGTAVTHAGEAFVARRMARRRGLPARGWALQTFVVGFPSLLALRKTAA